MARENENYESKQYLEEDRIEGDTILLNGEGKFPKKLIISSPRKRREYELRRTRHGKYQLT